MKIKIIIITLLSNIAFAEAQLLSLDSILYQIESNNPELQMYDAQSSAFDAYAKGAKAWEAPQLGAGFFMTPYNPSNWKADKSGNGGMGSFMLQGQQMIPNPGKQRANQQYMQSMSAVELANKNFIKNDLVAKAKMSYVEWIILKKKMYVLDEQEQLMNYVIKTSEIRYPYQQEKLSSIYKAKASLAEIKNMRLMFESEINWKKVYLNQLMNRDKLIEFEVDTNVLPLIKILLFLSISNNTKRAN
jgi:outer membrane protein TolC